MHPYWRKSFSALRPGQNGCNFTDAILQTAFSNAFIEGKIVNIYCNSLVLVAKSLIDNDMFYSLMRLRASLVTTSRMQQGLIGMHMLVFTKCFCFCSCIIAVFCWKKTTNYYYYINQHWFRKQLGMEQAASHCLDRWWSFPLMHICVIWPQLVRKLWQCQNMGNFTYHWSFVRGITSDCWIPLPTVSDAELIYVLYHYLNKLLGTSPMVRDLICHYTHVTSM